MAARVAAMTVFLRAALEALPRFQMRACLTRQAEPTILKSNGSIVSKIKTSIIVIIRYWGQ